MKKITLLFAFAALMTAPAFSQSCCKKGEHCTKNSACCKDKKSAKQNTTKQTASAADTKVAKKTN